MASVRQLRRRIRSVENTAKITKAMSMIAASKMRRVQEAALQGRPYTESIHGVIANLMSQIQDLDQSHPLLEKREPHKVALLLISPDRGLTGGMNTNINRAAAQFILGQKADVDVIALGKKGGDFMARTGHRPKALFTDLGDRPSLSSITPPANLVMEDFITRQVDAVFIVYARFVSTVVQRPVVEPLLPVIPAPMDPMKSAGYIYEPDAITVLSNLLPKFVEMQIFHALLEGIASEQSARMVAMQNATENSTEMVGDLTLVMNKARQETITNELLDIVGGVEALNI